MDRSYFVVLFLHSWLRWVVLGAGLTAVGATLIERMSGRHTGRMSTTATRVFVGTIDTQVLLGLILYLVLSPIARAVRQNFPAAMHDPVLRFFGVEHMTAMALALVLAHASLIYAYRAPTPDGRRLRIAVGVGLTLLLLIAGMPWPGLPYGRDLFRSF